MLKICKLAGIFAAMALSATVAAGPEYAGSFQVAKKLIRNVYSDNQVDQYCGCEYNNRGQIDLQGCGYEPRKDPGRAKRLEIEHVTPAENIGRQFSCWKEGGREHCNQTDQKFRDAHNDLHNLMPVVGEVNGNRSNFRFSELPDPYGQYGACNFKVDFAGRKAEPPPSIKGDVARISLYMRDQHGVKLSRQQEQLFSAWSKSDPVDTWELTRNSLIEKIQGNSNPYVRGERSAEFQGGKKESAGFLQPGKISPDLTISSSSAAWSCSEKKACSRMTSCEEAVYHLNQCGNVRIDANGDGIPCESLCK